MARIVIDLPEWFTHQGCLNLVSLTALHCADRVEVVALDHASREQTRRVLKDRHNGPSA
jgi:hypothetical protein